MFANAKALLAAFLTADGFSRLETYVSTEVKKHIVILGAVQ